MRKESHPAMISASLFRNDVEICIEGAGMTAEKDYVEQHVGYHLLRSEVHLRLLPYLLAEEYLPCCLEAVVVGAEERLVGVRVYHKLIAYLLL